MAVNNVRLLRSEAVLHDIPVLYKPGAVFVLQGSKRGVLEENVYLYDEEHYLAVSMPVPFRIHSTASPERPLLAIYLEFDMPIAAGIAAQLAKYAGTGTVRPQSLVSSRISPVIEEVLLRLLTVIQSPADSEILGAGILHELYYRVMTGPQGGAIFAALQQKGPAGRVIQSLNWLREHFGEKITLSELAKQAGMSVPSYHAHFRTLTASSPIQYIKAMRLHEARLMLASRTYTIADVASRVGYVSPAQFSRDFRRHFGKTASQEMHWMHQHLGEPDQVY